MVTVITKTIGSGKDYASFTLAEADVTNIGTSADLVANDEAIVFEADAGTYSENVTFSSTLTTDATRQVTYKPASGAEHGGVFGAGANLNGACLINDNYMSVVGFQMTTSTANFNDTKGSADGLVIDSMLFESVNDVSAIGLSGGGTGATTYVRNCVSRSLKAGGGISMVWVVADTGNSVNVDYYNNTVIGDGSTTWGAYWVYAATSSQVKYVNCIHLGERTHKTTGAAFTISGSNNFGSSTNPFPVALRGSPATITPTTSFSTPLGSGDYAVYMGATGALADVTGNDVWQQGVGPSVNSDVPTTDINGVARSGATCNPGAFEADGFVAPTVLTRTIKPVGGDYASFTLAEADVTNIGGSADLTFENEAIVFEADAGTYSEFLQIDSSSLVSDSTRNVTYKAAPGAEHGGIPGSGVHLASGGGYLYVLNDFTRIIGLSISGDSNVIRPSMEQGLVLSRCILDSSAIGAAIDPNSTVTKGATNSIDSCVVYGHVRFRGGRVWSLVNNTILPGAQDAILTIGASDVDLVNTLILGTKAWNDISGGTVVLTGSSNFGPATNPLPVALQGSPYPVTATTDLDPGPGDWAIYDATNGALIDDPDNDVLAGGIGPDANPDVPTTDIIGNPRTGLTTEPGAFVLPPPPVVEEDTWTPVMVRRNDPVDVYGVLTFGDAYINAVEDTLSVTGADGTDATPAIPVGTRALWIQLVSQTGAAAGETCDVSIEVSASQSLTLATLNGAGTAVGNVPGLMQFPVDCLGQNDPDTPVYPRVKMVTGSTVGASDVVTIRVVAICGQQTNTTWS